VKNYATSAGILTTLKRKYDQAKKEKYRAMYKLRERAERERH
jgi:hypothetical protein